MLRTNSLAVRLMLSHLLVIALALGLLGFAGLSLVQGYFVQAAQQSALTQARLIARACEVDCASGLFVPVSGLPAAANVPLQNSSNSRQVLANRTAQSDALEQALPRVQTEFAARARVLGADGQVRLDSATEAQPQPALSDHPLVRAALLGRDATANSAQLASAAVPLLRGGRAVGAVLVEQDLADVLSVLGDIRSRLLLAALPALLVSALLGWGLSRAITRPMRQLNTAAQELAQGNFAHPLMAGGDDELGALSTSFVRMRSDLQRMFETRTNFVADVSHELRTPLTGLKGLLDSLLDGAADDPDVRERFLRAMRVETDRLIRLTSDLLTLTKADSGVLRLDMQPLQLDALARDCSGTLAAIAHRKHLKMVVSSTGDVCVNADADRLRQVLLNVIDNAVTHAPAGSSVTMAVARAGELVRFTLRDTGPGMTPETQARAFDRFYRAEQSRARNNDSGAGLGLAIAKALVEAHGGTITLVSQVGTGTEVCIMLPAC